jgi:protein-S-isoprenylcysteine O-methyltransferase Ste14
MYLYIIVLILGFGSNLASTFTSFYSSRLGSKAGTFITILLRDVLGIPVWAVGFLLAVNQSKERLIEAIPVLNVAAWILIGAGAVIIITALFSIRTRAAAPTDSDSLVTSGIYSVIRHPINIGTLFEFAGLFLLWPSLSMAVASLLGVLWVILQSLLEEADLLKRIPGYSEYRKRVPAFLPHLFG